MSQIMFGDDADVGIFRSSNCVDANSVYVSSTTGNISSGSITIGPNSSNSSIWTNPSTWTYTVPPVLEATYTILKLPRKKMPEKVFVEGLLKTCGLLGTDAECAYTDKAMIIFSPNVVRNPDAAYYTIAGMPTPGKPTISIEYHDAIYHYVVDHVPVKGDKSTVLDVRQVGMVKKGK